MPSPYAWYALSCVAWIAACTDHYECGVRVGEEIALCEGENQVCVCDKEPRCAEYNPSKCPHAEGKSEYSYVFGDKECVPVDYKEYLVQQSDDENSSLCSSNINRPLPPGRCGEFDRNANRYRTCPTGSACVCTESGGVCATKLSDCEASGYAVGTGCLPIDVDKYVEPLEGELCEPDPSVPECGVTDASGRLKRCDADSRCACNGAVGHCVLPVDKKICASGYLRTNENGLRQCESPDSVIQDQGPCSPDPPPTPVRCGVAERDRLLSCASGEYCTCQSELASGTEASSGVCTREQPECLSGFQHVHDLSCTVLRADAYTVHLSGAGKLCPLEAPKPISCGMDIAVECAMGAGCLCASESHCVTEAPSCTSRLAFLGTLQCVPESDRRLVRTLGACPTDGGTSP